MIKLFKFAVTALMLCAVMTTCVFASANTQEQDISVDISSITVTGKIMLTDTVTGEETEQDYSETYACTADEVDNESIRKQYIADMKSKLEEEANSVTHGTHTQISLTTNDISDVVNDNRTYSVVTKESGNVNIIAGSYGRAYTVSVILIAEYNSETAAATPYETEVVEPYNTEDEATSDGEEAPVAKMTVSNDMEDIPEEKGYTVLWNSLISAGIIIIVAMIFIFTVAGKKRDIK